jgi:DNA adenine methylase
VPYGHYNNVEIINKAHLEEVHDLIKDVVFECSSFDCSLPKIREGDFAYLDPPYAPESDNSFVGYTEHGFSLNTHLLLFEMIHKLAETDTIGNPNKKILLSNSDVPLVRENFDSSIFKVNSIVCKRSINSKNPSAKTMEVLIKNY